MAKEASAPNPDDICWVFPPTEEEESVESDDICWVFPPSEVEEPLESVTDRFDINPEWDAAKFFSDELYGDLPTDEKMLNRHTQT